MALVLPCHSSTAPLSYFICCFDLQKSLGSGSFNQPACQFPSCPGAALAVAIGLAEASFPNRGVRILTFVGGACTSGPGTIVNEPLKETIRSHHDIDKDDIPHMRKAAKVCPLPTVTPTPIPTTMTTLSLEACPPHVIDHLSPQHLCAFACLILMYI